MRDMTKVRARAREAIRERVLFERNDPRRAPGYVGVETAVRAMSVFDNGSAEMMREQIIRDITQDRARYREGSDTWKAMGFCLDIVEKAQLSAEKLDSSS
jgi:hypothetical protein